MKKTFDTEKKLYTLSLLVQDIPGVLAVPPALRGGRAAAVALVAKQMARHGETVLPEALLPDYHRLSQAERERAEAEAAARAEEAAREEAARAAAEAAAAQETQDTPAPEAEESEV